MPHPPGFTHSQSRMSTKSAQDVATSYASLKQKRAWDLAISPAKSLPMQAFMLYMSGGGVQIFSMGIVAMLLFNPFKALAAINAGASRQFHTQLPSWVNASLHTPAFAPFAPIDQNSHGLLTLLPQKLAYLVCNALTLALGLWKCRSMGLLPTGTADWLAFETRGAVSLFHVSSDCSSLNLMFSEPSDTVGPRDISLLVICPDRAHAWNSLVYMSYTEQTLRRRWNCLWVAR